MKLHNCEVFNFKLVPSFLFKVLPRGEQCHRDTEKDYLCENCAYGKAAEDGSRLCRHASCAPPAGGAVLFALAFRSGSDILARLPFDSRLKLLRKEKAAEDGSRTRTPFGRRILSPLRLPFRHLG